MSTSRIITNHPTPGEFIQQDFLDELGITAYRFAKDINVLPLTVSRLLHGESRITPNLALRLEKYFGMSAQFWLNLQQGYDLSVAERVLDIPDIKRAPGLAA